MALVMRSKLTAWVVLNPMTLRAKLLIFGVCQSVLDPEFLRCQEYSHRT